MSIKQFKSYTQKHNDLAHALKEDVLISADRDMYPNSKSGRYTCVFDTGASCSAINKKIARECNLTPISKAKVNTAGGVVIQDVYLVNIELPTGTIEKVKATAMEEINGTDVLIGMDIITLGDFAITNMDGKTVFSFRIPSCETIDYCKEASKINKKMLEKELKKREELLRQHGNEKCPCGSGRKYRYCCGKENILEIKRKKELVR